MSVPFKTLVNGVGNADPPNSSSNVSPATAPLVLNPATTVNPAVSSEALITGPAAAVGVAVADGEVLSNVRFNAAL